MRRIQWFFLTALMGCGSAHNAPSTAGSAAPGAQMSGDDRALMRRLRTERERRVSERGAMFERIAVGHDYTGEYVLLHDDVVTAFLDIKDPQHPRYQPGHDEDGPVSAGMVRTHILVVPNEPRETIGRTIAGNISAEDLEATLRVMHAARELATRLGIQNASVYVKSPTRIGVGYLHVHIVGERNPNVPYPAALR